MDIYILENNTQDKVFLQAIFFSVIESDSVIFFDSVSNLLDGIERLTTFDAVIFDISIEGSGLELIKDLYQFSPTGYCPIIIYSHHKTQSTIDAAMDLGVHSYIIKQLNPANNIQAITRAITAIRTTLFSTWD